jgi:hypothetical protein
MVEGGGSHGLRDASVSASSIGRALTSGGVRMGQNENFGGGGTAATTGAARLAS